MSEELLINMTPQETRVAFVENGVLQEVHIERAQKRGLVGNIYKGKVSRILPGMQAAFIEVGLERTAFLHASDIVSLNEERGDSENGKPVENIVNLLRQGQEIVVQVVKDPMGSKGARLTTQLSIPSRYMVFLSGTDHIGVSQKVELEDERQRLKDLVTRLAPEFDVGGYIIRTVAENVSETEIKK